MHTIGQLALESGLSRSALIYYDKIGLLRPSERSDANYRLFSDADRQRLQSIMSLRDAGLPLEKIAGLLDTPGSSEGTSTSSLLRSHLSALNAKMTSLRAQQRMVVRMLGSASPILEADAMDKAGWVALFRASGMSDGDMMRWHVEFERSMPEQHHAFLLSLGLEEEEATTIRTRSKTPH